MQSQDSQLTSSQLRGPSDSAVARATVPAKGPKRIRLVDLLAKSPWLRRKDPFPHIYVEKVFISSVYDQLVAAFRQNLPKNDQHQIPNSRLVYYGDNFDAYLLPFRPSFAGPLSLFISKAWVDLLTRVTGMNTTLDVNGALHYHAKNSKNGFIHKDFSSCWFVHNPRRDGVNVTDNDLCSYRTGVTSVEGVVARERVRAVAMLLYLNNPPWCAGDGGETGLYRTDHDAVEEPAVAIPPINNSMLIFECSPYSYHSFITNRRNARSSVALWLHRTKEDAVAQWGGESIVYING